MFSNDAAVLNPGFRDLIPRSALARKTIFLKKSTNYYKSKEDAQGEITKRLRPTGMLCRAPEDVR